VIHNISTSIFTLSRWISRIAWMNLSINLIPFIRIIVCFISSRFINIILLSININIRMIRFIGNILLRIQRGPILIQILLLEIASICNSIVKIIVCSRDLIIIRIHYSSSLWSRSTLIESTTQTTKLFSQFKNTFIWWCAVTCLCLLLWISKSYRSNQIISYLLITQLNLVLKYVLAYLSSNLILLLTLHQSLQVLKTIWIICVNNKTIIVNIYIFFCFYIQNWISITNVLLLLLLVLINLR